MPGEVSGTEGCPAQYPVLPQFDLESQRARVAGLIRAGDVRARLLPDDWGGDVAWDLMLALYFEHLHARPLAMAQVEATARRMSRCRWIDVIVVEGLAERNPGTVRLTTTGVATMRAYFDAMVAP